MLGTLGSQDPEMGVTWAGLQPGPLDSLSRAGQHPAGTVRNNSAQSLKSIFEIAPASVAVCHWQGTHTVRTPARL